MGRDLEREVFGGSESELSSDEDEELQRQRRPTSPAKAANAYNESSGGDSEDDYVQDGPSSSKPKKRLHRKGPDEEGGARAAPRKRKRKQPVEEPVDDAGDIPPEQAKRSKMNQTLDAILKPKKGQRRSKKKNEEVLDSYADDEVARLREAMLTAADEDQAARAKNVKKADRQPAIAKLRMLPEAMETLRKASLAQSMIDNNLLEAVTRWLEPLQDHSLPALNIQRELFHTIRKMEFIDTAVLKESGLGKIVLFYSKCPRVGPDISRIANDLVSAWSRPIIKRSASYRDKIIPTAEPGEVDMHAGARLNAILARAKAAEKNRVRKNAVAIPQRELGNYTVAPKSNLVSSRNTQSVDVDVERRRKNAERMRALTRKVNMK